MRRSSGWMVAGAGPGSPCSQQLLAGSAWAQPQPQPRVPAPRAGEAPAPGPARPAACAAAAACAALPIAACVIPALTGAGRGPISGGPEPSAHGPAAAAAREGLGPALGAPGRASTAQWGSTGAAAGLGASCPATAQWGPRGSAAPEASSEGRSQLCSPNLRFVPVPAWPPGALTIPAPIAAPHRKAPSPGTARVSTALPGAGSQGQAKHPLAGCPVTLSTAPHTPPGPSLPHGAKATKPEHHLPRPLHLHAAREAGAGASAAAAPS